VPVGDNTCFANAGVARPGLDELTLATVAGLFQKLRKDHL
jgi:hypothetical protein